MIFFITVFLCYVNAQKLFFYTLIVEFKPTCEYQKFMQTKKDFNAKNIVLKTMWSESVLSHKRI